MKIQKTIFVLLIFSILLSLNGLQAQTVTGADYLKMKVGPRQIGLGGAFTGLGDDVYTLYYNPAGTGFIRRWELSATYTDYFADMYYAAISGVKQYRILGSRKTAIGGSIFYHGMPDWNSTENPDAIKASAYNILGILSVGQRLDWLLDDLSFGINGKVGQSKLADYSSNMVAADLGLMYKIFAWNRPLAFGLAIQNIGSQTKFIDDVHPLPQAYRFGASYQLMACPWHRLVLASDVYKFKGGDIKLGFGAEYWLHDIIGLRGGYSYNQEDLGDITFGATVRFDAFNSAIQSDYAQTDFGNVMGNDYKGAISLHAVRPEPFHLLAPENGHEFCRYNNVELFWEKSEDPDPCDVLIYRVLVDPEKDKVIESVAIIKNDHQKSTTTKLDLAATENEITLPLLVDPVTYYWTIVAVDKAGHFHDPGEIRNFVRSEPDIIISQFRHVPSPILPDLTDPYQGEIEIMLYNNSNCTAQNFNLQIKHQFPCQNILGAMKEWPDTTISIARLRGKEQKLIKISWNAYNEGKHLFAAHVDFDELVPEMNDSNNTAGCEALTIPRGRIFAKTEQITTKKIIHDSCKVPVLPLVFFEKGSAEVPERFYQEDPGNQCCLSLIARRMDQFPETELTLKGFADPVSEYKLDPDLANKRAQKVYDILVDGFNISPKRLHLIRNHDGFQKRIERTGIDPRNQEIINEENRRVELAILGHNPKHEKLLFRPQNLCIHDSWDTNLLFNSQIATFTGCSAWNLNIKDNSNQIIQTIPFQFSNDKSIHKDSLIWIGTNYFSELVNDDSEYHYTIQVEDKMGRKFETVPKNIFVNVNRLRNQERHVFLSKFNDSEPIFTFYDEEMKQLACRFIDNTNFKAEVRSSTCEIGTREFNEELIKVKGRSDKRFALIIEKVLRERYGSTFSREQHLQPVLDRITFNKPLLRGRGALGNPLTYNSPCCCFNSLFLGDDLTAEGRNFNRHIEILLYTEQDARAIADK